MVTDQLLITYIQQIAELFCSESPLKTICRASVKQRLVNDFTDETFSNSFLPFLQNNRFYFYTLVRVEPDSGMFGKLKVVVEGYDVLTGKRTGHVGIGGVSPEVWNNQNYAALFSRVNWVYIDKKPGVGWLVRVPTSNTYNIVFVPGSAGGGGGGGAGQQCPPGYYFFNGECMEATGGIIIEPPPIVPGGADPQQPVQTRFDFESYLMPALLVGGGLVLYYFIKS